MLHIQHVLRFLNRRHYPFRFNVCIHERLPRISQARNISRRAIGRAVERRAGVFRSRENRVRKATLQRRAREGGQSSQSLGHSQYGSLWCNRDAEAPCFCAFGERSRPSNKPVPIPLPFPTTSLSQAVGQSLAPYSLSNLPT